MSEPIVSSQPAPAGALLAPVGSGLGATAVRTGHDAWWASRLFEVAGGWVPSEADAEAKLLLARHAAHFAWRAGQWVERLPALREVGREQLVASPGAGAEALVPALAAITGTVGRLAGLYRVVLPRLVVAHQAHLGAVTGVADAPLARTLRLLLPEEQADWAEGEALLEGLLTTAGAVTRASGQVAALESLLV